MEQCFLRSGPKRDFTEENTALEAEEEGLEAVEEEVAVGAVNEFQIGTARGQ